MKEQREQFDWNELKDIWRSTAEANDIQIKVADLIEELQAKTSQFEKDAIHKDLEILQGSWSDFKGAVSEFEKNSIKKDLSMITRLWKRMLGFLGKKD